jgi:hypothetical protein
MFLSFLNLNFNSKKKNDSHSYRQLATASPEYILKLVLNKIFKEIRKKK